MADTYQPMFNRTYLKVLLWVIAIAIVLLSASGRDTNDYLDIQRIENKPVYFTDLNDAADLSVQMIFALGPALNDQQKLLHKLLAKRIQHTLSSQEVAEQLAPLQANIQLSLQDDRFTLLLSIPANRAINTDQLTHLQQHLIKTLSRSDLNTGTEAEWARLKAEQYLENQASENHLLSVLTATLTDDSSVHPLQRFSAWANNTLSTDNLYMAIHGPDAATAAQALAAALPARQQFAAPRLASQGLIQRQTLPATGNEAYTLIGQKLPGRQSENFTAQLIAVKSLQRALPAIQPEVSSRLIWKSLDRQGYFALLLYGQRPPADTDQLAPINKRLLAATSDDLIDATRTMIKDNFLQQMSEQPAQLALLNTLAFYQLPLDYISGFATHLSDTGNDQVREQLNNMLNTNEQQFIYLPAR